MLLSFWGECCFRQSLHVALTVLELNMNIMLALNSQRLLPPASASLGARVKGLQVLIGLCYGFVS